MSPRCCSPVRCWHSGKRHVARKDKRLAFAYVALIADDIGSVWRQRFAEPDITAFDQYNAVITHIQERIVVRHDVGRWNCGQPGLRCRD